MKTSIQKLSFGLSFILTGCVTIYEPNAIHSPLLKEKGDLSTSVSLAVSGCGLYNLQSAYAVSNHMGVMINGMYHNNNTSGTDTIDNGNPIKKLNIFFGEAGTGYFTRFGDNKNGLFQCYGGGGYGTAKAKFDYTYQSDPFVKAEYFNIFLQPGIAYSSKYYELAFDLRANYVKFFYIHSYQYFLIDWLDPDLDVYSDTTLNFVNLEPAVTLRVGSGKVKGFAQFGVTLPIVNADSYRQVHSSSILLTPQVKLSFGINYTFGTKRLNQ